MIYVARLNRCRGTAALGCAALLIAAASPAWAQGGHRCAAAASTQARALLSFHVGGRSDVDIDDGVRLLGPLRNPANRRQTFDVLEVQGHVYRADYRMRLIYARVQGSCVLMGQEVIEQSSL